MLPHTTTVSLLSSLSLSPLILSLLGRWRDGIGSRELMGMRSIICKVHLPNKKNIYTLCDSINVSAWPP